MFFETTIMVNTADLANVQKTIIDTLLKEDKSQRVITERGSCSRSAVSKHIKCEFDWKKLGRKMCTSRDDRKLENTIKQSRFKHLRELHKEWTEAGVSASRVITLRQLQEKSYQATSETEREASYLGQGEKELDYCSVVQSPLFRLKYILHFIWKSRSQSLEEEWSGTESMLLEVQCEVSTVSDDLGCHVILCNSNFLRHWILGFHYLDAIIINISRNKGLKYFTLCDESI